MLCAAVSILSAVCCIKCANSRSFLQPHIIAMRRKWQRSKVVSANILGAGGKPTQNWKTSVYISERHLCPINIHNYKCQYRPPYQHYCFYTFICHESNEFLHADSGLFLHLAVEIGFLVARWEFQK